MAEAVVTTRLVYVAPQKPRSGGISACGSLAHAGFVQGRTGSKISVTYANSDLLASLIHMLIDSPHKKIVLLQCKSKN